MSDSYNTFLCDPLSWGYSFCKVNLYSCLKLLPTSSCLQMYQTNKFSLAIWRIVRDRDWKKCIISRTNTYALTKAHLKWTPSNRCIRKWMPAASAMGNLVQVFWIQKSISFAMGSLKQWVLKSVLPLWFPLRDPFYEQTWQILRVGWAGSTEQSLRSFATAAAGWNNKKLKLTKLNIHVITI